MSVFPGSFITVVNFASCSLALPGFRKEFSALFSLIVSFSTMDIFILADYNSAHQRRVFHFVGCISIPSNSNSVNLDAGSILSLPGNLCSRPYTVTVSV